MNETTRLRSADPTHWRPSLGSVIAAPANNILRRAILGSASNRVAGSIVRRYGMRLGASRFVAGETLADCLRVTRELNDQGMSVAVCLLGEHIGSIDETRKAVEEHEAALRLIRDHHLDANVTVKLTHLGLSIDHDLAYSSIRRIVEIAASLGQFVRIDMEESAYVDGTLDIYRRLRTEGYGNVGAVLQAYLYRSMDDLHGLLPLRPSLRLVKGAYLEPPSLAYPQKSDVDSNFRRMIEVSLVEGGFTAIATHDVQVIEHAKEFTKLQGIRPEERFEFQMLYGIRSKLQRDLVRQGYPVRTAVPVGTDWYAYLMRRLAERPANLLFFVRNAFKG